MVGCAVLTCRARIGDPNKDVMFHSFPVDEDIKKKWIDMTGRDNWSPTKASIICSKHFRDSDYFIQRSGKRYLRNGAIPCEYVVYRHLFPDEDPAPSPPPLQPAAPPKEEEEELDIAPITELLETDYSDINENSIGWEQLAPKKDLEPQPKKINRAMRKRRRSSRKAKRGHHKRVKSAATLEKKLKLNDACNLTI